MQTIAVVICLLSCLSWAASLPWTSQAVWRVENFQSLITFGDSYTDEDGLTFFALNNFTAPPLGTFLPGTTSAVFNGQTWPRYVVQYVNAELYSPQPQLTLYNYAISGAVCSNEVTPRTYSGSHLFPDVLEYEISNFLGDVGSTRNGTGQPYFGLSGLTASNAIYALWIGTNDLGVGAFLTDNQVRGKTIKDYTDCIFAVFDKLYASGARVFVLFNNAPLDLAPLYANATQMGVHANEYWPNKPKNITSISYMMQTEVVGTNAITQFQTPFSVMTGRYPGASFARFDVHQLLTDVYNNPAKYLNGSQPSNTTGFEHHCNLMRANCTFSYNNTSPDSFMWYDELHPSEQTDRIIARNFVDVLNGNSTYAAYYQGY